jgi:hypothetical protein
MDIFHALLGRFQSLNDDIKARSQFSSIQPLQQEKARNRKWYSSAYYNHI